MKFARKICSNLKNIVFGNKDSILTWTLLLNTILKPSNVYSCYDCSVQTIIYFNHCLAPYFLNRPVTSFYFCWDAQFMLFVENWRKSCFELFVTIVGLQSQIAFLHTHAQYLSALFAEIPPDLPAHKTLQPLPQRKTQNDFLQSCCPQRSRLYQTRHQQQFYNVTFNIIITTSVKPDVGSLYKNIVLPHKDKRFRVKENFAMKASDTNLF